MRAVLRILLGLPGAAVLTLLLFFILAVLIRQQAEVQLDDDRSVAINVTRQIKDTVLERRTDFQRPVLDQPPPPPPSVHDATFRPEMSARIGALPDLSMALDIGTGFNPDREAQPLVRIPPQYPDMCQSRAKPVEAVVLEFDVSPEGVVVNPKVVTTTNACFDRAAMRAVSRWRYEPKVEGGQARPRFGVRTQISFQLEG